MTRSGLVFHALDIINHNKPKYAIAENVKNLISKRFIKQFKYVLDLLDHYGYNNYWQVLNSKDYGIPQNRERVFIVSIRKDVDDGSFSFPPPRPLDKVLADFLDDEVDSKYYYTDKQIKLMDKVTSSGRRRWDYGHHSNINDQYSKCLTASMYKGIPNNVLVIGEIDLKGHDIVKRVYSPEGCSPTIPTGTSGNTIPKILQGTVARKFTPKEALRLMGFSDEDFDILRTNGFSDSAMYKMAGNSIVVPVLEEIFKSLFKLNKK